eukprot:gene1115-3807_t
MCTLERKGRRVKRRCWVSTPGATDARTIDEVRALLAALPPPPRRSRGAAGKD